MTVAEDDIWNEDWTPDLQDRQQQAEEQWQAFEAYEKKNGITNVAS